MKALSVRAPWWWYIIHGYKDIENREWKTQFRGRVLIHAGHIHGHRGIFGNVFPLHCEPEKRPHVHKITSHRGRHPAVARNVFLNLGRRDFANELFPTIQEETLN